MYFVTALVAAVIVAMVEFAGAGQPEAQCRGNSPKKICASVLPTDGATVSGTITVTAQLEEAVASVTFDVDDKPLSIPDVIAPYEATWDTTKWSNGTHVLRATAVDSSGKLSAREHRIDVSNATAPPPPPPGDTTAPSVGLTSPSAGATVSGSVSVAATASDNVAVVGVQFKIDGGNLGAEDTTAPYAANWSSGNVSNGAHNVTAVARDAAGNTSSSLRSVTVSNDTTAPTVGLTSPASGATVSGSVSVAATAADNVAVVGVQFKIDGGNLGAEDTTAPYSVSWSSGNVSNGAHNVTAVARDAAGNTANSQRTVTVSNSSGSGTGPKVAWAPPALSNAVTITVTNANRRLYLDNARDYRLNVVEPLKRELWIEGGRNVVVLGAHITIDQLGGESSYQDNTALKIRYGAAGGTVHVEGLQVDGPYVADGVALATPRHVQLQNVRIERVTALKGAHPDCIQTQQGVGALRVDRFSCSSDLQGIFLRDDLYPIGASDFRHVNITGAPGKHLFWQTTPKETIRLSEVWLHTDAPWGPFGWWVYPNTEGKTWDGKTDLSRIAVVSADGSYLWFTGATNTITGRINKGRPPGGDFVPRSVVGVDYVSPGYG